MNHGFLFDMDGVIYRSNEMIPGSDRFFAHLMERNIPFMFITNNSQRTRRDVATKLNRMGVQATEDHVFTCAMATARFLARQKPHGTAFVIGEGGLIYSLHRNGYSIVDHDPDYVVVGEGRTFNMEIIEKATAMIFNGAKLIATNMDVNCPTAGGGTRPGCGAIVSILEKATGIQAFSVGKPSPFMLREARKDLGLTTSQVTCVGDMMDTDILGGAQLGYRTVLVLSGGTTRDDLKNFAFQPDIIVDKVADLLDLGLLDECLSPMHDSVLV